MCFFPATCLRAYYARAVSAGTKGDRPRDEAIPDAVPAALAQVTVRARRVVAALGRAPVSLAFLVALWVAAVVSGSVLHGPSHWLAPRVGLGVGPVEHGHLWVVVTSGLWAHGLLAYVVATILVLAVAVPVERRIGSGRFAVAALVSQVLGALLTLGFAGAMRLLDESWGFRLHLGVAIGPGPWILGALMAATAHMGTLWRRRIRVAVLAFTLTLALFGGQLQDVFRVLAAVVGLVVGVWLVGRSARGPRISGTRREGRVLVAIVVAAGALGPVAAALSPDAVGPLAVLSEMVRSTMWTAPEVRELCVASATDPDCRRGLLELRFSGIGPTLLSILPPLFVVALADGLRRGRRFAWWATAVAQLVLLAASLGNYLVRYVSATDRSTLFYGLDDPNLYRTFAPFLVPAVVLAILLSTRRWFDVRAPRGTYRRFWTRIALVALALASVYVLGALLDRDGFDRPPGAATLLGHVFEQFVPPVYLQWLDPSVLPVSVVATFLYEWTGVVFWVLACVLVLATFLSPAAGSDTDSQRARELLSSSTGSPLAWMTTWDGNSYWFGPDGRSYVAYRVIGGVALTTGDPVGPPDRLRSSIVHFAEFAAANGWTPCFYSVTEETRAAAAGLGWGAIRVAEETVLDLGSIAFTGKRFQDIRTALNKARKQGIAAEWVRFPSAPLALTDQITAISEEWVADKDMPEMGFTLGGIDEIDDPQVRCLLAVDADRTVHGVTSWLPVYRDGEIVGWTLDFMRRRADGFRPAMEFLIASAALDLEREGYEFVSLSGAPLAKIEDEPDAERGADSGALTSVLGGVLDLLGRTLEPVYGFRSLLAFKAKFKPRYESLYLAYPDPAALPSIGNAVGRAYLPDMSFGQGLRLVRSVVGGRR